MPTGSGKTTVFSFIAAQVPAPVLVLAHRRELVTQASTRMHEFGVDFGLIIPGAQPKPYARVQIASKDTLVHRKTMPPARLVICDEAHLSTANTWTKILAQYPTARILGCTATPWRLGGKPLAGQYDRVIVGATPRELREGGSLCDYNGFSYLAPDLSDVDTTAGDYNEKQSSAAAMKPAIVANIVEQWKAHASELSTIVFAVTVPHSQKLAEEFRAAGIAAEHIDGTTPQHVRDAVLRRVAEGRTRVLCNVGVLIEGLDIPRLKCCVLARPTKSLARYLQMTGRVRRPWEGVKARIHDHAFLIAQHGLPDDDRDYTLTAKPERAKDLRQCKKCFAWHANPSGCPSCGKTGGDIEPTEREVRTIDDAELFEFDSSTKVDAEQVKPKPRPEDQKPVEVRWLSADRERWFEGEYLKSEIDTRPVAWGPPDAQGWQSGALRRLYWIRGERRVYVLSGTAMLDQKMTDPRVKPGRDLRVMYVGDKALPGGRWKKVFKVEVSQ